MISSKKLTAVALLLGTVVMGGSLLIGSASASNSDHRSALMERIATKFNLNTSEVETVFNEERDARRAEMKAKFEDRLAQAVRDGKITDAQKSLIIEKHESLINERETLKEAWRNMTREERKSAMEKRRNDLESWMKANNIPDGIFGLGMGMGKVGRGGHGMGCAGK